MPAEQILFPTGRLVYGTMKGRDTDGAGKPLLHKTGAKAGQPKTEYSFGVAIPKAPGQTHWAQKPADWDAKFPGRPYWGERTLAIGAAAFPNVYNNPNFAWKIIDGDSQIPNQNGKKPCDQTGYAGHWVVKFNSGFAPKVVNENGTVQHTEDDYIKTGYYVQVFGSVDGNGEPTKAGVYINHNIVSLQGYGEVISSGPDASSVGFGGGPAPAGMSTMPVGGMSAAQAAGSLPQIPGAAVAPQLPQIPGAAVAPQLPQIPGVAAPAAAGIPALPGVAVTPNPAILTPAPAGLPAIPGIPTVPAVPAVAATPRLVMTARAPAGSTPELFRQGGWTDQMMVDQGMAVWQ